MNKYHIALLENISLNGLEYILSKLNEDYVTSGARKFTKNF